MKKIVFVLIMSTIILFPSISQALPLICDFYQITCFETDNSDCIKKKGNGDIWITIKGPRKEVSKLYGIQIDPEGPVPVGFVKHTQFFVFDEGSSTHGMGFINGLMYFQTPQNLNYYVWPGLVTYTTLHEWEQALGIN